VSFREILDRLPLTKSPAVLRFERLIAPCSDAEFEQIAQQSRALTRQNFGRTMRLFAPLYLSNECINNCRYCGFSRDNPILRVTLETHQVIAEARHLAAEGFRQILLVAGEHPKFVSGDYLSDCVRALAPSFSSIAIEVGPMETEEYRPVVDAGAEALVVYQETYDRDVYAEMHTSGPKRDFNWRLDCPERGYEAGFRRIGIGALFGLAPWREEAIALAAHVDYLLKRCWQAQISVSLPRLRPAAGGFEPAYSMTDRELAQLVCALRVTFPQLGIVLSTRERAPLRDALVPLGVTMMSAGSHTEPGGYTHQGSENLHLTVRGRIVAPEFDDGLDLTATGQFEISDERSPTDIAASLRRVGLEPVWKDWDQGVARPMNVWLNGEAADARGAATIAELADKYGLQPNTVLVEHNGIALHQREWRDRALGEGDRVEFVRVVAGG
jgi:2-iminoacetate synthase